jgi:hypothetical protein
MWLKGFVTAGLLTVGVWTTYAQTHIYVTQEEIKNLFHQAINTWHIAPRPLEWVDGCDCMPYEYNSSLGKQVLLSFCPEDWCKDTIKLHFSPEWKKWTDGEKAALKANLQLAYPIFTR